ncbi:MAG: hypothetical protein HBSAPP02_05890 [Phycisphaerae bacterium]|nr:MAG: VCBS repeat-containing protein [Planctomycetia bacterium]RIK68643.1 MAG: hypothetical protein DCC66_09840 [Planctomycetota bacterium]GJQ25557.1 MAG: hypothetical protein HBSAPP02_05890 [Phycisphaerae bacterium]
MRRSNRFSAVVLLTTAVLIISGCTELYLIFGPGGPYPPGGSNNRPGGSTTQPSAIPGPLFASRQIDPTLESTAGARVIVAADLNGDGLTDFVSGSAENQPVQIHLRDNAATLDFTTFSIAGGAPISTMYDLAVDDFDQDGRLDIAVLVNDTGFVPVTGATKRGAVVVLFAPVNAADALLWQATTITSTFFLPGDADGVTDFAVGDFDGVAGPDIVLGSNEQLATPPDLNPIYLYANPGGANARSGNAWVQVQIGADVPQFKQLEAADIDADGDLDIVATYPFAKSFNIRWLRNPLIEGGTAAVLAGNWITRTVGEQRILQQPGDEQVPGADFVSVGDVDGDGDLDVVSVFAQLDLIQWFENPGASVGLQTFPWNVYNLGTFKTDVSVTALQLVDLNLDGRLDCFAGASGSMVGYQPGLDPRDFWTPFTILGTNPPATIGRCAFADIDGNGLLDIAAPLDRDGVTQDQFLLLTRLTP